MADYDSSLPVRTETDGDVVAKIVDTGGSNEWSIDANNIGQVNLNDGTNSLVISASGGVAISIPSGEEIQITDGTDTLLVNTDGTIGIGDGTEQMLVNTDGSISTQITDGTDALDINSDGSVTSQISDGTDTLAVNADGSINVVTDATPGTAVQDYGTAVAGVPGTPNTVVDRVQSGADLYIQSVEAACSGKFKVELKTGTDGAETTKAVAFGSTSSGFAQIVFPSPVLVADLDSTLLIITNNDKANADVYGFVNGYEI